VDVVLADNALRVGTALQLTFQRTLRIPNDGQVYPLPPGLGRFPIYRCADYPNAFSAARDKPNQYFIPMYQREALWLGFGSTWPPRAIKVAVGSVNAVSGEVNESGLHEKPQNYVVCPEQLWLDGVNTGPATVRQFVAVPLGEHSSVEAAITHLETIGGIQLEVYAPKIGATLKPPSPPPRLGPARHANIRMGLAAGGQMTQKIYPDPHGVDVWCEQPDTTLGIHILNSEHFRAVTGIAAPPSPIDAQTYTKLGLPWFELYEEHMGDVAAPAPFAGMPSTERRDQ